MSKAIIIIASLLLFFIACNKNSLELPPLKNSIFDTSITCLYGNTGIVRIELRQDTFNNVDRIITVKAINLTSEAMNTCKVYIEMCDGAPSINSCQNQYTYIISQLETNKADSITLPFRGVLLRTAQIVAGIVSFQNKFSQLSDVYDGESVQYLNTTNAQYSTGSARGVVFADGQSVFRMSLGESAYNIEGKLGDTSFFNGGQFLMYNSGVFSSTTSVTLGYFNQSGGNIKLGFPLASRQPIPATPSFTDSILLKLKKQ